MHVRKRWLNRDPIGERGGINLYTMLGNEPVAAVDSFGLSYGPGWTSGMPSGNVVTGRIKTSQSEVGLVKGEREFWARENGIERAEGAALSLSSRPRRWDPGRFWVSFGTCRCFGRVGL